MDRTSKRFNRSTKEMLVREYQHLLWVRTLGNQVGRLVFLLLLMLGCAVDLSNISLYLAFSFASVLFGCAWFAEAFTSDLGKSAISRAIGRSEEGLTEREWEDSLIVYHYFLSSRIALRLQKTLSSIEPFIWMCAVIACHRLVRTGAL